MSTINQSAKLNLIPNPRTHIIRTAWILMAVLAAGVFIASIPGYMLRLPDGAHGGEMVADPSNIRIGLNLASVVASMSAALLSIALAWLLFHHKPNDRMAVFLSFFLLVYGVGFAGPLEALISLWPEVGPSVVWAVEGILVLPMSLALFMLFPDGRFVPSGMRWIVLASIPIIPISIVLGDYYSTSFPDLLVWIEILGGIALLVAALYAQIYRYREVSSSTERQQTKWVVYGMGLWVLLMMITTLPYMQIQRLPPGSPLPPWAPISELIWFSSLIILPLSLTISVWRYRLYDIDIIINRTLVYSLLTIGTLGIYVVIVGFLGNLFQVHNSSIVAFLATGLVAVLFQPFRDRLQRYVNRMMYGERDNPLSVLSKLGIQLEKTTSPHAALSGIVEMIAHTLKLPYVAIEFGMVGKRQRVTSFGRPPRDIIRFPIKHQSQNIGNLSVAPRSPSELFNDSDNSLLENIARQAGSIAQIVKLTADLQNSRQRLVFAREEERLRIRRDLHDGLGPTLASQGLKIAAASQLLDTDPEKAGEILKDLTSQSETSVAEIRRLVHGLRPAALDELGLLSAVRDYASGLKQGVKKTSLSVEIHEPKEGMPSLSAAVEVAAYRIATEALTNVSRHSQAQNCAVYFKVITMNGRKMLHLEVKDDGKGLPKDRRLGVGLNSMRERAEEIGGSFQMQSNPGHGTQVVTLLPLME